MLSSKDVAGAADDPPLSAAELSQAFSRAQEQREREEEQQQEGDRGGEKEKGETASESGVLGLGLDRREKRGGGGRWKRVFLRCFCGEEEKQLDRGVP
jgi:hypothetical protein